MLDASTELLRATPKVVAPEPDEQKRARLAQTLRRRLYEQWLALDSSASPLAIIAGWSR